MKISLEIKGGDAIVIDLMSSNETATYIDSDIEETN
jgi:hypothetical protein